MKIHSDIFNKIISLENLFISWEEFKIGKTRKKDVLEFGRHLEDNLFSLHRELKNKTYRHSDYTSFYITDPKLRHIHKAKVKDRIVHHAVHRILYPVFDPTFICDSYSCRLGKGTHKAVRRLEEFTRKVSKNYTGECFVLKCDIRKYFASVDHGILLGLIGKKIKDRDMMKLIGEIVGSFDLRDKSQDVIPRRYDEESQVARSLTLKGFGMTNSIRISKRERERESTSTQLSIKESKMVCGSPHLGVRTDEEIICEPHESLKNGRGIPLGNLTSQLFANVYLNELDQYVKHKLRVKYYIRYCDDFVIISDDKKYLKELFGEIDLYLKTKLRLTLHPDKIEIRKLGQGIDFLGYVVLPHYKVLRTKTKKRMFGKISEENLNSYLGILKHCNGYKLGNKIKEMIG